MEDNTLLELAAKAANYEQKSANWNPLENDGDAFRLAVKLKLSIWFEERTQHEWSHIIWVAPVFEPYTGDVNAAVRRAIVRAAAALQENK